MYNLAWRTHSYTNLCSTLCLTNYLMLRGVVIERVLLGAHWELLENLCATIFKCSSNAMLHNRTRSSKVCLFDVPSPATMTRAGSCPEGPRVRRTQEFFRLQRGSVDLTAWASAVSSREGSYTILYYTILYYTILYYTILYYTILYYTILYYTILYYTILYYTILYYTILYYTILSHLMLDCRLYMLFLPEFSTVDRAL